ncbi:6-phosphofructokinase [Candidatus Sumerlaeota bacterium]|nr:6-phosphofructokinase [Candidatus Sumerlaeota bacterium]
MAEKLIGNAIIGQSGGPTCVINQSLVGVVEEAQKHAEIKNILGARHGVQGMFKEDFIQLKSADPAELEAVAITPSAGLGSVRHKVNADDCGRLFEIFKKNEIRYMFYIGGNDSAETAHIVNGLAREAGYEFRIFHVPKTIDNDLRETDHCPGYGSAAKFVALALMGDNLDNRSIPGIKIDIVMGRHAGFLTAAAALGRKYEDDGPHLVYLPERPFSLEQFATDVERVYKKLGRCVVAVSEGIADENHEPIAKKFINEVDSHGNVQLSGSGALGDHLAAFVKKSLGEKTRVRADTFGYLQRCFPGCVSEVDAAEAREVGRKAVDYAMKGNIDGSVIINRLSEPGKGEHYMSEASLTELENVAKYTKSMPDEFINAEGNNVTQAYIDYALPLLGKIPQIGRLY